MNEFKVGDRVRRAKGYSNRTLGITGDKVYTVVDNDQIVSNAQLRVGLDALYVRVLGDAGTPVFGLADHFTLEPPPVDFEAQYNTLVADLVRTYSTSYLNRLEGYDQIVRPLLPKPKRYDVTVRVPADAFDDDLSTRKQFANWPVQSITEVTE
jgi:hypothetical protein